MAVQLISPGKDGSEHGLHACKISLRLKPPPKLSNVSKYAKGLSTALQQSSTPVISTLVKGKKMTACASKGNGT